MNQDNSRRTVNVEEISSKAMLAIDGASLDDEVPTNMALMAYSDSEFNKSEFNLATNKRGLASLEEQLVFYKKNEITDKSRKGVGFVSYNAVPPPHTGLISPLNLDLSYSGLEEFQQPELKGYEPKTSNSDDEDISNVVRESPDAPLVEELVSDDKLEKKTIFSTVAKIEFVRPKQQEKPVRKPVKYAEMYMSQSPRGNQRNWNNQKSQQLGSDFVMYNKACFVCGSFDHVQADCNYHQRERVVSVNNYTRADYNWFTKKAHPSAYRNMVLKEVLIKTVLRPLNTARPKAVNTTRPNSAVVNVVRETQVNAVKALAYFKDFDRGYVTFGGGAKRGKITGKGTLKTGKLDFEGSVVQGKGSTHPVESHHTPTSASSTLQPPISSTSRRTTRQESVVPQPRSPTQTLVADETVHEERGDSVERAATTATSLDAECQDTILGDKPAQTSFERLSKQSNNPRLSRVNTLGSGEDSMTLQELMVYCTTLSKKLESLETDLKQTKQIYGAAYTRLIKKVKKLEKTVKSSPARRRARIVVFDDEDDLEDPSKQGRKIAEIDQDPSISLVQHDVEIQGRYEHDMEFDFDFDAAKEFFTAEKDVSTAKPVSTAGAAVTTSIVAVSTVSPTRNTRVPTADEITMAETMVYIWKSAVKDKGKGKMDESETVHTKTKLQQ
ncbi:hypothetical protein Tco_1455913 [Tanacetum coccineum]